MSENVAKLESMTGPQILKAYFYRPGVDTLQSFLGELKALTPWDKAEMIPECAAQLGVVIKT